MTAEIAASEPTTVVAGDTVKWKRLLDDYLPEDSWVLTYEIVGRTTKLGSFAATDNGDSYHLVTIAASVTALWAVGDYTWFAFVAKGTERFQVDDGTIEVKADLAVVATHDGRSHAKITLEAIESVIEGRATKDQMAYTIAGRSLARTPIPDLLLLSKEYEAKVEAERQAYLRKRGKATGNSVRVGFGGRG